MRNQNDNWSDCDLIERVPGKMNGEPVIKGTRVMAQTLVDNFEGGSPVDEIAGNYPHVPADVIRKVIAFHQRKHQPVP